MSELAPIIYIGLLLKKIPETKIAPKFVAINYSRTKSKIFLKPLLFFTQLSKKKITRQ